jgi:hypothetical protein
VTKSYLSFAETTPNKNEMWSIQSSFYFLELVTGLSERRSPNRISLTLFKLITRVKLCKTRNSIRPKIYLPPNAGGVRGERGTKPNQFTYKGFTATTKHSAGARAAHLSIQNAAHVRRGRREATTFWPLFACQTARARELRKPKCEA